YAVPVVLLTLFQDRFVYLPDQDVPPTASALRGGQDVTYSAADGTALRAWFVPAKRTPTGVTAVVFHGTEGNRSSMASYAGSLADAGISVLLAEYRGYGGVAGTPSEDGLRQDGQAAVAYVRQRPGIDPTKVIYVGYSLGTGVAVEVAETDPPTGL